MRKNQDSREAVEKTVRDIKRRTRRQFGAEDKIRIVLQGLRGEESIAEICRKEGLHQNLYYRWSKEFLEAGKKRLAGDTVREAGSDEVKALRRRFWSTGAWSGRRRRLRKFGSSRRRLAWRSPSRNPSASAGVRRTARARARESLPGVRPASSTVRTGRAGAQRPAARATPVCGLRSPATRRQR